MTSARRTPRYVGVIPDTPSGMGPHLMGPQPLPLPASPAAAATASRRTGILPLHPERGHGYTPVVAMPAVAMPVVAPTPLVRRAPVVPVERRPWRVMVISTAPGAVPRSVHVRRWHVRAALGALGLVSLMALGFVAAIAVAVRSPELVLGGLEGPALRAELEATRDSLESVRASLAEASESGDAEAAEPTASRPVASAPKPADHPRPLRGRPAVVTPEAERGILSGMPRSLSDLPVIGAIASGFSRARLHPILHRRRPHLGVDVAAPRGTRVSSPAPGRVQFVGHKIGFGLVVELDHGHGIVTRYAHLRSAAVEVGEVVTKGEAIAAVGTSGLSTGPHLHYEVLDHGRQVDPLRFRFGPGEPPIAAPLATTPPAPATPVVVQPAAPAAIVGAHEAPAASAPAPR